MSGELGRSAAAKIKPNKKPNNGTITGGDEVFHVHVGKNDSTVIDISGYHIFVNPGETITCSANTIATGSDDMSCALIWEEIF